MAPRSALGWIVTACFLAGCTLQPSRPPAPAAPEKFAQAAGNAAGKWPSSDWYRGFGSSELDGLIDAAMANNFDLQSAHWRIQQALERATQARAGLFPSVDLLGNINRFGGHSSQGSATETDWAALLSASYEIDFWGKNRAAADSARDSLIASRADRETLALTTLSAVANEYFQLLSLRERLTLARSNVDAARNLAEIVSSRYKAGLANPSDVAAQRAALAVAQLQIPDLERLEEESVNALASFLGRPPEGFSVRGVSMDSLQEPAVAPGLPAELLRRRPDILLAEANLAAASADTVVAKAALYPSLSLTLQGGIGNPAVNAAINTLGGVGPGTNLGAALTQPIFDAGKLRSQSREAQAKEQEVLSRYKAAIVAALVDVENALGALHHLDEAREAQNTNLEESTRSFEAAQARYQHGNGDFLTVLEAQKVLFAARDQYSLYKLARLQAVIALCKALGGGWQAPDNAPTAGAAASPPSSPAAPAAPEGPSPTDAARNPT
jgi:outer membrane protein, multidrug efflux system